MIAKTLLGIAVVALAYVGFCALLYVKQRGMMYFPQYTRVDAAATDFLLERDGLPLRGWVLARDGRDPILYFGGNAERIEDNREAFARLFPGRTVYLLAYRGYGASEGSPSEDALSDDAVALFDDVRRRHPGQPIAVIGRSLGSGRGGALGSRRPGPPGGQGTSFDSMAAVAQSHYRWLPVRWLLRDRYDSVRHLHGYGGPVLVIRAGRDEVIPAVNTDRLIASLPEPPQVVDLAAADHNTLDGDPAYGRALSNFLCRR